MPATKFLLIALLVLLSCPTFVSAQINKENIEIVRDKWGVPHIFAETDEEMVYGLAWATSEDALDYMLESLLAVRGRLGEIKGKDGAILDFAAFLLGIEDRARQDYHLLSDEFKKMVSAYVQAVNRYGELHPEEIPVKNLLPITEVDLLAGYMLAMSFINNIQYDMAKLFKGQVNNFHQFRPAGSNAIALNSKKTTNGNSFLAINSHQPLVGPYSWYEAHIVSEESNTNVLGGTFPGGLSIFHGTTPNHGWAHTVNWPDFIDVYRLTMHPNEKLKYKYDGKWETLQVRKKTVKVKIGFIKIPITKTFYWSKYGSTLKNKEGFYSIRYASNMEVHSPQAWFELNQAQNLEEFKAVVNKGMMAGTNIVFADVADNLFFISTGIFPKRDQNYSWKEILPGDTSATFWDRNDYLPTSELLQINNPPSGYIYNMNNTPYKATGPGDNVKPEEIDPSIGYMTFQNNRSLRFEELIADFDRLTFDDFKKIKYDLKWRDKIYTHTLENVSDFFEIDPEKYPELAPSIEILKKWDKEATADSPGAGIFATTLYFALMDMFEKGELPRQGTMPVERMAGFLSQAQKHLKKHFGKVAVPLGEIMLHVRGDRELPAQGTPDVLAAMYMEPHKKGRFKTYVGESYIQMVELGKDGVKIQSINCYGASNHPDSPHFDDQMEMYLDQQLKPMTLDRETIFKEAVRVYHPE